MAVNEPHIHWLWRVSCSRSSQLCFSTRVWSRTTPKSSSTACSSFSPVSPLIFSRSQSFWVGFLLDYIYKINNIDETTQSYNNKKKAIELTGVKKRAIASNIVCFSLVISNLVLGVVSYYLGDYKSLSIFVTAILFLIVISF